MNEFFKKVVLVTGGTSGIGAATAKRFAQHAATVIITGRSYTKAQAVIQQSATLSGSVHFFETDFNRLESVQALFEYIQSSHQKLDIAINNAATLGCTGKLLHQISIEDWQRILQVNLTAQWLCMKHEVELMQSQGGSIINIASVAGLKSGRISAAYTAVKHGLIGLTKAAAIEYIKKGIRVNAVCPAFIDTPMLVEAELKALAEQVMPIGRCGSPEEVAEVIIWLASQNSSLVNGVGLSVDSGLLA